MRLGSARKGRRRDAIRLSAIVLAVANLMLCAASAARADDFTFRRIGVPGAGSTDRITVQIDPAAPLFVSNRPATPFVPLAPPGALEGGDGSADQAAGVEWFWNSVSPLLSDSGPGRFVEALRVVATAPEGGIPGPRLQTLQEIASVHGTDILRQTVGTRVSPALVLAVIAVESGGRPQAVSHAGAAGLMQLMPGTAARFGVQDRLQPAESIRGGVAYLDWLIGHFGGDPILALAAYNAGEGAVENSGGVPPYAETRAYVPKVLAAWNVARGLCQTPPELASDGCVFMTDAL